MNTWGSAVFAQYGSSLSVNWWSSVLVQSREDLGYEPVLGHWTLPLAVVALTTTLGTSLPHGWNTGVLNAPQDLIISFINESQTLQHGAPPSENSLNWMWSFTVASYLAAGMIGAFSVPLLSERFGRRNSILILHGFVFVAAVLMGCAKMAGSFPMLLVGRIIVGLGCGAGTGLVPMYLTEIAPINLRGALGTLHQLYLTLGILVTQILGLRQVLGTEDLWPWLLAGTAVPSFISLCILPWFPDSPRFLLINKGNEREAHRAMQIFRGEIDVKDDINELKLECQMHEKDPDWSLCRLLQTRYLAWPMFLVCSLALVQQLGGINVIFYYSTSVFVAAGIPDAYVQYATLATGVINTSMTLFSVYAVEKFGRRSLLVVGMSGMCLTMTVITVSLNLSEQYPASMIWPIISLCCVLVYVISFALGLGSIPQFIGAEMFKQGPRPPAMAFAGMLNWLANFLVGLLFPYIQANLKAYSFIIFLGVVFVFLVLIYFKLPETKDKTFEDIAKEFHIKEPTEKKSIDMEAMAVGNRLAHHERESVQYANIKVHGPDAGAREDRQPGEPRKTTRRPDKPDSRNGGDYLSVPTDPRMPPPTYRDPNDAGREFSI